MGYFIDVRSFRNRRFELNDTNIIFDYSLKSIKQNIVEPLKIMIRNNEGIQMKTYTNKGTVIDVPYFIDDICPFSPREEEKLIDKYTFFVQEDEKLMERFVYTGDSINSNIDVEICSLYDTFQNILFDDSNQYYNEIKLMPMWVQKGGQDSNCDIGVEEFNKRINDSQNIDGIENIFKHIYLVDFQYLIGTIANFMTAMEDNFIRFYIEVPSIQIPIEIIENTNSKDETITISSIKTRSILGMVETYFVKAYSILDIICKICFEIQNMDREFRYYKKLKCAKVTWGNRKELDINEKKGTLFENCPLTKIIESLRNEIVHNGTWELNPKIFIHINEGEIIERYMFFPDIDNCHLATSKNRRHFFSQGIKVNDIFPDIHMEFKNRLLNTISYINNRNIPIIY